MGETGKESGIDIKDLLVRENIAKREDVEWAEKEILKNPRKQVVDALLEAGRCHEKKLASLMSALYGYRLVSLKMLVIHEDILALIPPKIAEAYSCIPVSILDKTLTVAFANPTNLNAIDEVQIVTGKRVRAAVAEYSVLKECFRKIFILGPERRPCFGKRQGNGSGIG